MKRSEAIRHIINVLRLTGNHYCDNGRDETDANRILERLEDIGMLPPPTETDVVTDYLVYCYYPKVSGDDTDQIDVVNSQLWKPEDETK